MLDAGLLAAVCEFPSDDTPRLIAADWLEENGQAERAEFIRVQCALAEMERRHYRECTSTTKRGMESAPLRRRERELLSDENRAAWCGGAICRIAADRCGRGETGMAPPEEFRRGFVEALTCSAADFLAHADSLCWHPSQKSGPLCQRCINMPGIVSQWCLCPGRAPRPCPVTAQPVRRVVLSTWPQVFYGAGDWVKLRGREQRREVPLREAGSMARVEVLLLAAEWSWIEFTLPPPQTGMTSYSVPSVSFWEPETIPPS